MRTAGQGQAAVPRERVRRRRSSGLPGPFFLGREITSHGLSRKWSAIQISPCLRRGISGFTMDALLRAMVFILRERGSVCPQTT